MATTDIFILRLIVYIIFLVVTGVPDSLCMECGSLIDDNINEVNDNDSVTIPLESYCIVNECAIRIKESNVLLNVIYNTGGWIIATNTTSLFIAAVNSSIQNCSSDTETDKSHQIGTGFYVIRFIIYSIGIITVVANFCMHLMFKELRTVSGILIMILCISISIEFTIGLLRFALVHSHTVTQEEICTIFFFYPLVLAVNLYEATKITILVQFAYTMYRSYKVMKGQENKRSLLFKYITFIILASIVSSASIITVDLIVNRNVFQTSDGRCINSLDTSQGEEILLSPSSNILYSVILIIWIIVQILLVTAGYILYFMTTKQCCVGSVSKDFRVIIVLTVTIDLNIIVANVLLFGHISVVVVTPIVAAILTFEQVALFILFASSNKVMWCCKK